MSENKLENMDSIIRGALISLGIFPKSDPYEDCFSEARLAILECPPDSTFGYRFTRARWAAIDYIERSKAALTPIRMKSREISVEDAVIERVHIHHIHSLCLKVLSPTERVVLTFEIFTDLPRQVVAETLGISERYVRIILNRAINKARIAVKEAGYEFPLGGDSPCSATT